MSIYEFPDQYTALEVNNAVYYPHLGSKLQVGFGVIIDVHYRGDEPVLYDIATVSGSLTVRRPEHVAPVTPANTAYLAGECRRAYDRAHANYRVASIYEPTTTEQ